MHVSNVHGWIEMFLQHESWFQVLQCRTLFHGKHLCCQARLMLWINRRDLVMAFKRLPIPLLKIFIVRNKANLRQIRFQSNENETKVLGFCCNLVEKEFHSLVEKLCVQCVIVPIESFIRRDKCKGNISCRYCLRFGLSLVWFRHCFPF